VKLSSAWDAPLELEHDPIFVRRRRAIEARLLVRTTLGADEIADLLASQ
jgi:hypothetical protein